MRSPSIVKQNPSPVAPSAVRTVTSTHPTDSIRWIDVPTGRANGTRTISVERSSMTLPASGDGTSYCLKPGSSFSQRRMSAGHS